MSIFFATRWAVPIIGMIDNELACWLDWQLHWLMFFDSFFTAHSRLTRVWQPFSYALRTFDVSRLKQPSKTPIQVVLSLIWSWASTSLLLKKKNEETQIQRWALNMNHEYLNNHDKYVCLKSEGAREREKIWRKTWTIPWDLLMHDGFLYLCTSCGSSVFHELVVVSRTRCPTIDFPFHIHWRTRFLLNFDSDFQNLWIAAKASPSKLSRAASSREQLSLDCVDSLSDFEPLKFPFQLKALITLSSWITLHLKIPIQIL